MARLIKKSVMQRIEKMDAQKRVNPLDLSADQDLTVALMNLAAIEECGASGDLLRWIHDMKSELMMQITSDTAMADLLWKLLGRAMEYIEIGNRQMESGDVADAYATYDAAYGVYSVFWGVNMGLMDIKDAVDILDGDIHMA